MCLAASFARSGTAGEYVPSPGAGRHAPRRRRAAPSGSASRVARRWVDGSAVRLGQTKPRSLSAQSAPSPVPRPRSPGDPSSAYPLSRPTRTTDHAHAPRLVLLGARVPVRQRLRGLASRALRQPERTGERVRDGCGQRVDARALGSGRLPRDQRRRSAIKRMPGAATLDVPEGAPPHLPVAARWPRGTSRALAQQA